MTHIPRKPKTTLLTTAPANPAAPTLAELEAGTDMTPYMQVGFDQLTTEPPRPVQFLNLRGNHLGQVGQFRGPMYQPSLGDKGSDQMLTVVTEEYDLLTDRTRQGLTYGLVPMSGWNS